MNGRDLLPHELAHSWNGKFRRPADLWTPNFNTPMRGSLLWVYEAAARRCGPLPFLTTTGCGIRIWSAIRPMRRSSTTF